MSTIRNVIQFLPKVVSEIRERADPLDLKQQVIRDINWSLSRLESADDERSCLKFLIEHRKLEVEGE